MIKKCSIRVLNPNSSRQVTAGIEEAVRDLTDVPYLNITCSQLDQAPVGIETAEHIQMIEPMIKLDVAEHPSDAHVIACFSDPAVQLLRDAGNTNIFGIAQSAMELATSIAGKFGIISILAESVERHRVQVSALGLEDRLAADIPLALGVQDLVDEEKTKSRLIEIGTRLKLTHRARSLILGCAGMARYRCWLQEELDLPIIEPCQAAIARAMAQLHPLNSKKHKPL